MHQISQSSIQGNMSNTNTLTNTPKSVNKNI